MLPAFAFAAVAAAAIAGAAVAAPKTHVMNVNLPDGSVARVEYVGDVAPKVTVAPRATGDLGDMAGWGPQTMAFPSFAGFDQMIEQMQRQSQEMVRQAQQMAREPARAVSPYVASYGSMPAGQRSTTVVTVSNNGKTCTRSTEIVSQGPGKPPKVTSNASGDCAGEAVQSAKPIDRT